MAEEKTEVKEVVETKKKKNVAQSVNPNIFPLTTEALEVLSKLYSMPQEEWGDKLSSRDKEILQMPMLFLAQKMFTEFNYWTVDLIKYLAFLNGLDIKIDHGNWFIKIEEVRNEG